MPALQSVVTSILTCRMPVFTAGSPVHLLILAATIMLVVLEIRLLEVTTFGKPPQKTQKIACRKTLKIISGRLNRISFSKRRVFPITGLVLLISEVFKQIFLTWIRGGNYSWSDFPFQLCSTPMYIMLFYPFLGGRARKNAEGFLMTFGLIGGTAALTLPVSIFSDYVLLTLHSLLWHMILIFTAVFVIWDIRGQSKLQRRDKLICAGHLKDLLSEYLGIGNLYLCLAAMAILINAVFRNVSNGTANMFFMGPSRPDMFILDDIYMKFGWLPETIIFAGITWLAGFIVFVPVSLF